MGTVSIPLNQGKYIAVVDEDDLPLLAGFHWSVKTNGYGRPYVHGYRIGESANGKRIQLHRHIMNAPTGIEVDHEDNDSLNCSRANLRLATHGQNQVNTATRARSGYRGVYWHERDQTWMAIIKANGKQRKLGTNKDPAAAARLYDRAAHEAFGAFARLNFPAESEGYGESNTSTI